MDTFNIYFKYQNEEREGTAKTVSHDGDTTIYNVIAGDINASIKPTNSEKFGILWVHHATGKASGLSMLLGEAIERAES